MHWSAGLATVMITNAWAPAIEEHEDRLVIQHPAYERQIFFSRKEASGIVVVCLDAEGEKLNLPDSPYFEFVLDGALVSSQSPLWRFLGHAIRRMSNDGLEIQITFEGLGEALDGFRIVLYQQIFPQTSLVRERIELAADDSHRFHLNKREGSLHFRFPQYTVADYKIQARSTEIRIGRWNAWNHMFSPQLETLSLPMGKAHTAKGPVRILETASGSWFTAYEHASQDGTIGLLDTDQVREDGVLVDGMQGTKGVFHFPVREEDFFFLGIVHQQEPSGVRVCVEALRGAYLEGEVIDSRHSYKSVWTATAFYPKQDLEEGKALLRDYLLNRICECDASRRPAFYYNTWGWQRSQPAGELRSCMTYKRILEQIEYAHQLGVDIFVLDDGWEEAQGVWIPHSKRLPEGLAPIREALEKRNMTLGVWFSPMGIDKGAKRFRDHPEWVILDSNRDPIQAQWGHPAFDFVSEFYDVFLEDCAKLLDEGVRYFKWDAINTFLSCLPNLGHGTEAHAAEERRARYEYALPLFVTSAMEELTLKEPELIIEMDLTEARRAMIGLSPLSQGKLYWINNGASGYNDYGVHRSQSMRTIVNQFAGLLPLDLFTFAYYPHNKAGAMEYNVNSALLGGRGFWGDLSLMSEEERLFVGKRVRQSKALLPYLSDLPPRLLGKVGDSPEVYTQVHEKEAAGQIVAFAATPCRFRHVVKIDPDRLLAVLHHAYRVHREGLVLDLELDGEASTALALLIPNQGKGVHIVSSTTALEDISFTGDALCYTVGGEGRQELVWGESKPCPRLQSDSWVKMKAKRTGEGWKLHIDVGRPNTRVLLSH